ncbi:CPCC family cysteine-rich protein [Kribbella sp. HUAS MG21]|uniref:CPCC family cysteine-rich protein n=1 Tax=Kribbella sp. HUAS MG21 TaxID=3160966 RepID=A0AAU7TBS5_9ACTN
MAKYPCPCCGYLMYDEEPGSYEICEVCGWEDDLSQLRFATMGGANRPLIECQRQLIAVGKPTEAGHRRDPGWRPLDLAVDQVEVPEPGRDYGLTYAQDRTAYYWRR